MCGQILHPNILLTFIRWQPPISPSHYLGSYSIRGVLRHCSDTFPSLQPAQIPRHDGFHDLLMIWVVTTALYCFVYSRESTLLFYENII